MVPHRLKSAYDSVLIKIGIIGAAALLMLGSLSRVEAWGPHSEITDAAIAVLPPHDQAIMIDLLGDEARRLRFLVWMGDFGNQFITWDAGKEASPTQFYANDYLIFPQAPRLYQHECPDVQNTYAPFFIRALQAIQTETPANAARWIGSLLHFQTDTGAPPHAAGLSGEVHSKMENWVVPNAISIIGYQPRLLGRNVEEGVQGFERRMAGLIEFSKQRAERLYPFINANDRPGAEPIVLESANETARVEADLLHTLLFLSEQQSGSPGAGGSRDGLEAGISAAIVRGFDSLPAKLMIAGSNYSTTSELITLEKGRYRGVFLLRNVHPGSYRVIVSRMGSRTLFVDNVVIKPGSRARFDWNLEPDSLPGNLVRNPDFRVRWSSSDPDNWGFDKTSESWVSDNIKVYGGARYRFQATPQNELPPDVSLQWFKNHWQAATDPIILTGKTGEMEVVAPENAQYARLYIKTRDDPACVVSHIALARLSSDLSGHDSH